MYTYAYTHISVCARAFSYLMNIPWATHIYIHHICTSHLFCSCNHRDAERPPYRHAVAKANKKILWIMLRLPRQPTHVFLTDLLGD